MASTSALKGIAAGKAGRQDLYFEPGGEYLLEVLRITTYDSEFKGPGASATLRVIESKPGEPGAHVYPPGTDVAYTENLSVPKRCGGGRFKAFLAALFGADGAMFENVPTLAVALDADSEMPVQPGAFLQVRLTTKGKAQLDKNGQPVIKDGRPLVYTRFFWQTVSPTDEQITAIDAKRKAAGLPELLVAMQHMQEAK